MLSSTSLTWLWSQWFQSWFIAIHHTDQTTTEMRTCASAHTPTHQLFVDQPLADCTRGAARISNMLQQTRGSDQGQAWAPSRNLTKNSKVCTTDQWNISGFHGIVGIIVILINAHSEALQFHAQVFEEDLDPLWLWPDPELELKRKSISLSEIL